MYFASDNWAGAHPTVAASLVDNAGGYASAYGASDLDRKVERAFSEIFERDVSVFFVGTGTAANSLALSLLSKPGGVAFGHRESHIIEDEGGAPEFLTGGTRLWPVDGSLGRMTADNLRNAIARFAGEIVHSGRPVAISLTQATEVGTIYSLDDITELSLIAKSFDLPVHMDGARFANALVGLNTTPAEMTWKRGVDLLSFGGTKNGCWCAEAVVLFDPDRAKDFTFVRKRAAHLFSKSRFIAAQFDAYFRDDLWLETARHTNVMAQRLAEVFRTSNHARLAWEPQANEVFAILDRHVAARLQTDGAEFYEWHLPEGFEGALADDERLYRFVTSFATTGDEMNLFAHSMRG